MSENNDCKQALSLKLQKEKQLDIWIQFKGYLCYKMITPQSVLSEAQVKNFFIS